MKPKPPIFQELLNNRSPYGCGFEAKPIWLTTRATYDPLAEDLLFNSDTAFFDLSSVMICWSTGKIGLREVDDVNDDTRRWTIAAHRLLGLPTEDGRYLGNMICWKLGDR
jgi:hypothetical protein